MKLPGPGVFIVRRFIIVYFIYLIDSGLYRVFVFSRVSFGKLYLLKNPPISFYHYYGKKDITLCIPS